MQVTIQKWVNSQGIRMPKALLDAMGMMEEEVAKRIPDVHCY